MIGKRAWTVACWEYRRFAKPRDLLINVLVMVVIYGGVKFAGDFSRGRSVQERTVAVLDADALGIEAPLELEGFHLAPDGRSPTVIDSLVTTGDLDAALVPRAAGWQLRVRHERGWQDLLRTQVSALAWQHELLRLEPGPEVVAALGAVPEVATVLVGPDAEGQRQRPGTLVVVFVVGAMLLGLFTGFGYVFVAITAEKTQRTTESLLSILTPQQWIDGKIIGLMGVVLVTLLSYLVAWYLWQGIAWRFFAGTIALPPGLGGMELIWCILFAAAGFAFWFTLFALVAATIDDPNSSGRSALMFLPFLPLSLVFAGLDTPDAGWMRTLSLLPGVSPSAMPVRILRGEPAAWEIVLSLVLLLAGALALRWAAGRVFGVSMLMTGKEPGLREVWRWLGYSTKNVDAP